MKYCNFNKYLMLMIGIFIFLVGFVNFITIVFNPTSFLGCFSYICIGVYISFIYSNQIKNYSFEILVPKSIKSVIFERY